MDQELLKLLPQNITEYPNTIVRQTGKPLEAFTVFSAMELAEKYITTDLAYPGQQVAVYDGDDKKYKYYIVQDDGNNKTLDPVADLSSLAKVAKTGNYEDLTNKPDIPDVYNGKLTLQGNDGLTAESKSFTANNEGNVTFTVKHAVPEGAAASEKSGSKITSITTDKFGHVIAVGKGTDENSAHGHSAGTGISLDGDGGTSGITKISHADTSTLKEGNYGPSAGGAQTAKGTLKINVPQITIDGMGHVTNVVNKEFTVIDTDTASTVKSGDVLSLSNTNELSTNYSIKTTATVGNLASGTTVNGTIKELLDLVFGTPTKITSVTLTDAAGTFEKGIKKTLKKAIVKIQKGTANSLDKIEIKSGSTTGTVLATLESVNDGNNTINISPIEITSDTNIYAVLTHDEVNTKASSASKYAFYYNTYYGAVAENVSIDNITYTSLTKKNSKTGLKVTMSNQCAVLAIPGTATTIKDENNFDCTGNFSKTTKTITNSLGASTSYTIFKLITPVSGTKTYTVS